MEIGVLFVVTLFASVVLATQGTMSRRARVVSVATFAVPLVATLVWPTAAEPFRHEPPYASTDAAFAGSATCRGCHAAEYQSWHATFHRTMSSRPTRRSFPSELPMNLPDGTALRADGERVVVFAPGSQASVPLTLATGSHHYQVFWTGRGKALELFPYVYLMKEKRWIPRVDAFLQPPGAEDRHPRWGSNCIQCHSVAGRPASEGRPPEVAELGIACEACHGPAAEHVRAMQNPLNRYFGGQGKIVQPAKLSPARASAVCAQCHSLSLPSDEAIWWESGSPFRPGEPLERGRTLLGVTSLSAASVDVDRRSLFWENGDLRIAGREANGLFASSCYLRGKGEAQISCLSCHSMHASEPSDQLRTDRPVDAVCAGCHANYASERHTHHSALGGGASCIECHMPRTSYALFSAIRSHHISKPRVEMGIPSACNLCHLDRSEKWTAEALGRWYGVRNDAMFDDRPYGPLKLLTGDAGVRAILADVGADRAPPWMKPLLGQLLLDPYAAVRRVAARGLQRMAPSLEVNIDAPRSSREAMRNSIVDSWNHQPKPGAPRPVFDERGALDERRVSDSLASQDDRAITIAE